MEGLRKLIIKKYILLILNPNPNSNPNLGIQTMEFQILHCLKWPKQGIFKSMDFKSRNFSDYSAFGKNCITSMHDIIKYYINTHSIIFLITHIPGDDDC